MSLCIFSANMSATPQFVVSSLPYHHCNGSSVPATGCRFLTWVIDAGSHDSCTGNSKAIFFGMFLSNFVLK